MKICAARTRVALGVLQIPPSMTVSKDSPPTPPDTRKNEACLKPLFGGVVYCPFAERSTAVLMPWLRRRLRSVRPSPSRPPTPPRFLMPSPRLLRKPEQPFPEARKAA